MESGGAKMDYTLITGATSGIGLALAQEFADKGHNLIVHGRNKAKIAEVIKTLKHDGIDIIGCEIDLLAVDVVEQFDNIFRETSINYLILNAGVCHTGALADQQQVVVNETLTVNMTVVTKLLHLFLQYKKADYKKNKVLMISSTASDFYGPMVSLYFASKRYIRALGEMVAYELVSTNASSGLITFCPGFVETKMMSEFISANKRKRLFPQSPQKIAQYIYKRKDSKKAVYVIGVFNKLIGFSTRFIPKSLQMYCFKILYGKVANK